MNEREYSIIRLLINEMAFEGAMKHFREAPPVLPRSLFNDIEEIGFPERYDGVVENYVHEDVVYDPKKSVFENCYRCLRVIRNNIMHANKAFLPDTPERLDDLLGWACRLIDAVQATECGFTCRVREIKLVLGIESV